MPRVAGGMLKALAILACAVSPWLAHLAVGGGLGEAGRMALIAVPLLVLAVWAARSGRRYWLLGMLLLTGGAVYALERAGGQGLAAAYGLPHAAAYAFLLWLFGRTLRPRAEPLITTLARRVEGTLPPEIEAYTRGVTIAWCVFFAGQLVLSGLLLALAPLAAWSFFVNVLNVPLLAAMFVGEYAYRAWRHPARTRASIATALRAFARYG